METRVLVVGPSLLKNQGMCSILTAIDHSIICETVDEFAYLLEIDPLKKPNLILLFLENWEEQFRVFSHRLPVLNILALSPPNTQIDPSFIHKQIIHGCLPETAPPKVIIQAIRAVAGGYIWFSQKHFKQILRPPKKNQSGTSNLNKKRFNDFETGNARRNKQKYKQYVRHQRTDCCRSPTHYL